MTTIFEEKPDSRQMTFGSRSSITFTYLLRGLSSDTEVKSYVLANTPSTYSGLVRDDGSIEPKYYDGSEENATWDVTVSYGLPEFAPSETYESVYEFDTGGGTQHITQSYGTRGSYAASGNAPDYKGAIGVTRDSVEGVDIIVPVFNFQETHYLDDDEVMGAYKKTIMGLTGKVNASPFKGFAIGECLFMGASGSRRGSGKWEIVYKFGVNENADNLEVGGIVGISKYGWDYLWARYEDVEDSISNTIVKQPQAAYVERVYNAGDFSLLGIGV